MVQVAKPTILLDSTCVCALFNQIGITEIKSPEVDDKMPNIGLNFGVKDDGGGLSLYTFYILIP